MSFCIGVKRQELKRSDSTTNVLERTFKEHIKAQIES